MKLWGGFACFLSFLRTWNFIRRCFQHSSIAGRFIRGRGLWAEGRGEQTNVLNVLRVLHVLLLILTCRFAPRSLGFCLIFWRNKKGNFVFVRKITIIFHIMLPRRSTHYAPSPLHLPLEFLHLNTLFFLHSRRGYFDVPISQSVNYALATNALFFFALNDYVLLLLSLSLLSPPPPLFGPFYVSMPWARLP